MGQVRQQLLCAPQTEPLLWANTLTGHVGNTKYDDGATPVTPPPPYMIKIERLARLACFSRL
jgi:hypothetical protein